MQSTDSGDGAKNFNQHITSHLASSSSTAPGATAAAAAATTTTTLTNATTPAQQHYNKVNESNSNTPSKNPFKQALPTTQWRNEEPIVTTTQRQNGKNTNYKHNAPHGIEADPAAIKTPGRHYVTQAQTQPPLPPPDDCRQEDYRAAGSIATFKNWMIGWRGSRQLVLIIVAIALLLDNMLLTTVVDLLYT
ncbi:unnamed protein product [Ceratitis capitata]|uniref:(Mediterranean fruit fly) hypothetical protein n=1 Tax=Ceratitis capitata TaxID=7213 RepID=A0A811VAZ4_CERCA|nr:unnamed protein product [Ceratitis capitata]